jgi:hypothetical protein
MWLTALEVMRALRGTAATKAPVAVRSRALAVPVGQG